MNKFLIPALGIFLVYSCKKDEAGSSVTPFADTPVSTRIAAGIIDEASGIADSKNNPGFLWVQQDSDNPTSIYLLKYDDSRVIKIHLKGAQNRDWEDIALGKGPEINKNYLYLADIGDNNLAHGNYSIYRFEEPSEFTDTLNTTEKISFQYPDGPHDAEAILINSQTADIYIITKKEERSRLYKLAYPQSTVTTMTATLEGELPFNEVVSATISPDMKEIIIKTYSTLNYWERDPNEPIEVSLRKPPSTLVYALEPRGEAICFKNDNSGFFTISERPSWISFISLNFYKRK